MTKRKTKAAKAAAPEVSAPADTPETLTIRCPARSNAESGRCEKKLDVVWNEKTAGFEGNCETHLALRLTPELAKSCVKDADALKSK